MKKLLLFLGIISGAFRLYADDIAMTTMLINNYNYRKADDIWQRMRQGFKLNHSENSRVKYYENLYTKNPQAFNKLIANAKPYLYYILTEIERNNLPAELALIPGVESTFDPLAKNPGDAYAGMWQFVPMTGRRFNMEQNGDIDERRDIVKSTKSALGYLNYLYKLFGQWDIAIGAYNLGEGAMYKAVLSSGQAIGKADYDNLDVRKITKDYYPKIIALSNIIDKPKRFGIKLDNIPNDPYFAIVNPGARDIGSITQLANLDKKAFSRLNPQYKSSGYSLREHNKVLLPLTNQNIYYASIGKVAVAANANNIQLASNQETIDMPDSAGIKPAHLEDDVDLDKASLQPANDIKTVQISSNIEPATQSQENTENQLDDLLNNLNVNDTPNTSPSLVKAARTETLNKFHFISYTVNSGDTMYSIAKKFKININDLRVDNKIPGNNLLQGQVLQIRAGGTALAAAKVSS